MGRRWGAIRPKIAIFKQEKWDCYGAKNLIELRCYNISAGGDATENEDFQIRKQCLHGNIFSDGNDATESNEMHFPMLTERRMSDGGRGILMKMAIFLK